MSAAQADIGGVDPTPETVAPGSGDGRSSRGWHKLRRVWPVPVVVIVASVVAFVGPFGDDPVGAGEADVAVSGLAEVSRADGETEQVRGRTRLGSGDGIELLEGAASFELAGGVEYRGRARGPGVGEGTSLTMGSVPDLAAGELVVIAPGRTSVRLGRTMAEVRPRGGTAGVGRLTRDLGVGVAAYRGSVTVDSAGAGGSARVLRRLDVAAPGEVSSRPDPLRIDRGDRWDRRWLAPAIELNIGLAPLVSGFEAAARGTPAGSAPYLDAVLPPGPGPDALEALAAEGRDPGDMLVGGLLAITGEKGTLNQRWADVFDFRDAGASWGLVAMDQAIDPDPLLAALRGALDQTIFGFEGAEAAAAGDATLVPLTADDVGDPAVGGG